MKRELVEISVKYASEILGLTERAVIYKIQSGFYKGEKKGKKWVIFFPSELIKSYEQALEAKQQTSQKKLLHKSEISESLPHDFQKSFRKKETVSEIDHSENRNEPHKKNKKKFEDFRQLRAYSELHKLYLDVVNEKLFEGVIRSLFITTMERLAMGFYEFDKTRKVRIYSEARGSLACLLNHLVLSPPKEKLLAQKIFNHINSEIMGSMISIIRAAEGSWNKGTKHG